MSHKDAGHYAAKRPGAKLNEKIAARVREKIVDNSISCAEAHGIAEDLDTEPSNVGMVIDLLEARIKKCQLGLFGYGQRKKVFTPVDMANPEIQRTIEAAIVNGRLSCATAWKIAKKLGVAKMSISAACEKKIKICACQLGSFK